MTTLYLTRHGQTEWNVAKRMQGWKDSPLTTEGKKQAEALADRLKNTEFAAVYSSSSNRTVTTAKIICPEHSIITNDNLREICLGEWEGMLHDDIRAQYSAQYDSFWNTPHLYSPATGETFCEVQQRALSVIKEIISNHPNDNILVVTHSMTLKLLMAYFENLPLSDFFQTSYIKPTSLSIVKVNNDHVEVVAYGDDSHLEN